MKLATALLASTCLVSPAAAQLRQPASLATDPTQSPQPYWLLDATGAWAKLGTVNPATHVFLPAGHRVTPQSYGAICDGSNDDTAAVGQWWTAIAGGAIGYLPGGSVCTTTAQLASSEGMTIYGDAPDTSELLYTGSATTGNIFTIGPASGAATRTTYLSDLDFETSTTMTSGYILLVQKANSRINTYQNLWASVRTYGQGYNGVGFFDTGTLNLTNFFFRSQNHDAFDLWGTTSGQRAGAGVNITNGMLIASGLGFHVGGNMGGVYTSLVSFGGNDQNALIDTALAGGGTSNSNLQINFGNFTTFDIARSGKSLPSVELGQSDTKIQQIIKFTNAWFSQGTAGGNQCALQIDAGYGGYAYVGGTVFTNSIYGICNQSATAYEGIANNFFQKGIVTAIHDTASNPNIYFGPNMYDPSVGSGGASLVNGIFGAFANEPWVWSWPTVQVRSIPGGAAASLQMLGNGAPTDANNWDQFFFSTDGQLKFRALSDNFANSNSWLNVHRFGYVPTGAQVFEPISLSIYQVATLPPCTSGGFTTTDKSVEVGSIAYITNGVATPTFGSAVSATGVYGHHVTCANSNGVYGWIYE